MISVDDTAQVIAANLNQWMKGHRRFNTLKKVADRAQVGFSTVQRISDPSTKTNPTITTLIALTAVFDKTVNDIAYATANAANEAISDDYALGSAESGGLDELLNLLDGIDENRLREVIGVVRYFLAIQASKAAPLDREPPGPQFPVPNYSTRAKGARRSEDATKQRKRG